MIRSLWMGFLLAAAFAATTMGQALKLPPRPADALSGTAIVEVLAPLSLQDRESHILAEIARGNVPDFLRRLVPVTVQEDDRSATYFVAPDYLALGSNEDYLLIPMTPIAAQRIADLLDCTLPTRKMVDQIWRQAPVKLAPAPLPPSPAMITVPGFAEHNAIVRGQRNAVAEEIPLGALVAGTKKDVVISRRIAGDFANPRITNPVVIYGWHRADGTAIQPLYNGHEQTYADYSHGIRLVQNAMTLDGEATSVTEVLQNPALAPILDDEGTIPHPRYRVE